MTGELVLGFFVMFIAYLIYKAISGFLCWLCDRSSAARVVVQVVGTAAAVSATREMYNRSRRKH